jgi:hypothetical protein
MESRGSSSTSVENLQGASSHWQSPCSAVSNIRAVLPGCILQCSGALCLVHQGGAAWLHSTAQWSFVSSSREKAGASTHSPHLSVNPAAASFWHCGIALVPGLACLQRGSNVAA